MSALVPIEQKQVIFYEDEITAVLVEVDGKQRAYIPRPFATQQVWPESGDENGRQNN